MFDATFDQAGPARRDRRPIPVAVQLISIILFAAFAISVSIVAMVNFWPAGIALAVLFAWQWGRIPTLGGGLAIPQAVAALRPEATDSPRPSGNASFDAYRQELLARLEKEQADFEGFLARLRAARDRTEFEHFMDDRAARLRDPSDTDPA